MYSKEFRESLNAVEAAREANIALEPARMTAEEKEKFLYGEGKRKGLHGEEKERSFSEEKERIFIEKLSREGSAAFLRLTEV